MQKFDHMKQHMLLRELVFSNYFHCKVDKLEKMHLNSSKEKCICNKVHRSQKVDYSDVKRKYFVIYPVRSLDFIRLTSRTRPDLEHQKPRPVSLPRLHPTTDSLRNHKTMGNKQKFIIWQK